MVCVENCPYTVVLLSVSVVVNLYCVMHCAESSYPGARQSSGAVSNCWSIFH